MNIILDEDYMVTSSTRNFMLMKRIPEREDTKSGEIIKEKWAVDGYYSDIRHLLKSYLRKSISNSESTNIDHLIQRINEVEITIKELEVK